MHRASFIQLFLVSMIKTQIFWENKTISYDTMYDINTRGALSHDYHDQVHRVRSIITFRAPTP